VPPCAARRPQRRSTRRAQRGRQTRSTSGDERSAFGAAAADSLVS